MQEEILNIKKVNSYNENVADFIRVLDWINGIYKTNYSKAFSQYNSNNLPLED